MTQQDMASANFQKKAVAERREAEPKTGRINEFGLAVRQATLELLAERCRQYCCLPNFGRSGRSQDRVSVNSPLAHPLYPAEWMAETQFRTVDHTS